MKSQKYTKSENVKLILLIVICFLLLAVPLLFRYYYFDNGLTGRESYYHLRIAKNILNGNFVYDELSYNGRLNYNIAWPFLIAGISFVTRLSVESVCKVLPVIIGVISFLLFYLILRKIGINERIRSIAALVLIISPAFLFLFNTCNVHVITVLIGLLAFYMFLINKRILSIVLFGVLPLFTFSDALIILTLLLFYFIAKKEKWSFFITTLVFIATVSTVYYLPFVFKSGFEIPYFKLDVFHVKNGFQNFIFDLGGNYGLGVFSVLLLMVGIMMMWIKRSYNFVISIIFVLSVLVSYYMNYLPAYFNFIASVLIAIGILRLLEIKWESKLIKNLTVYILIIGMILSAIGAIDKITRSEPNKEIIESLENLKNYENGAVLSYYNNGYWINSIAGKPSVMDNNVWLIKGVNDRYRDSMFLFNSRNIDDANNVIMQYNIKYIWITDDMKKSLWKEEDDGLLFLLRYSKRFKKIHSNSLTETWEIV